MWLRAMLQNSYGWKERKTMHPKVLNIADYRRRSPYRVPAVIPQPEPQRVESRTDYGIPLAATLVKIGIGILIGFALNELRR